MFKVAAKQVSNENSCNSFSDPAQHFTDERSTGSTKKKNVDI